MKRVDANLKDPRFRVTFMINLKGKQRDIDTVKPQIDTLIELSKKDGFYFKLNVEVIPVMQPFLFEKTCSECLDSFAPEQFQYISVSQERT